MLILMVGSLIRTCKLMQNKRLILILLNSVIILLIPLIAMLFTDEVNWTLLDFVVGGALLFGTGLMRELVMNFKIGIPACRGRDFLMHISG